jgi:hypothetical protein
MMGTTRKQAKVFIDGEQYGKPHIKILEANYGDHFGDECLWRWGIMQTSSLGTFDGYYLVDTRRAAKDQTVRIGGTLDDAIAKIQSLLA